MRGAAACVAGGLAAVFDYAEYVTVGTNCCTPLPAVDGVGVEGAAEGEWVCAAAAAAGAVNAAAVSAAAALVAVGKGTERRDKSATQAANADPLGRGRNEREEPRVREGRKR